MRTITIPEAVLKRYLQGPEGIALEFAVAVDWPELRLTEEQIVANAVAWANNQPQPYPDHSIFSVTLPYIKELAETR